MNEVILQGRVSKDPTIESAKGGSLSILKFGLLVKNDGKPDEFYFIKRFGNDAQIGAKFLKQGDKVLVIGRVHSSSDATKKNYYVEIIADYIGYDVDSSFNNRFGSVVTSSCSPSVIGGNATNTSNASSTETTATATTTNKKVEVASSNNSKTIFGRMVIPDNIDELIG